MMDIQNQTRTSNNSKPSQFSFYPHTQTVPVLSSTTRSFLTHGLVLLRQKNALPSGIGRIFSLGGARSAIFNWTPPSTRRTEGDETPLGDKGASMSKQFRTGDTRRLTVLSLVKLLFLLVLCVFIDVHLHKDAETDGLLRLHDCYSLFLCFKHKLVFPIVVTFTSSSSSSAPSSSPPSVFSLETRNMN